MRPLITLILALSFFATGCRNASSGGAVDESDSLVSSAPLQLDVKDWIITSGFIVDLDADAASKRIKWLATQSTQPLQRSSPPSEVSGSLNCTLTVVDQGQLHNIRIFEGAAEPHPNGRVIYCDRNRLYYAPRDASSYSSLLQELGVSSAELAGVDFYRVPTQIVNAWATVVNGRGVIAVYDGLGGAMRASGIDEKSGVAITLGHELGHIVDMKKTGFTNLSTSRSRLIASCRARVEGIDEKSPVFSVRMETCYRDIASQSRHFEYSADNFAVEILARKKYPATVNPFAFADFSKKWLAGKYDAFGSHPEGAERGLQMERSLERAGIVRTK